MQPDLRRTILDVCDAKIAQKGDNVGVSFYAFFKTKNDTPDMLFEVAEWWIKTHQLDHLEKAVKIKAMIEGKQ